MIAARPPGFNTSGNTASSRSRLPISRLTSILSAWKVRAAGCSLAPAARAIVKSRASHVIAISSWVVSIGLSLRRSHGAANVDGIQVKADQRTPRGQRPEQFLRMPAEADGAVGKNFFRPRAQRQKHLLHQDRDVMQAPRHRLLTPQKRRYPSGFI